jgi:hypothetical protein
MKTGSEAKAARLKLGQNQAVFWGRVGCTQSCGSRYESGRDIPAPTVTVLAIAYGPEKAAHKLVAKLRGGQ